MQTVTDLLSISPYQSYAYAYPHKTAYRPLDPHVSLEQLWEGEDRNALFLYVHIPFCEMRCGFCNLFTSSNPPEGMPQGYLQMLKHEMNTVGKALSEARFARMAIGGGTPTFLTAGELADLFAALNEAFDIDPAGIPVSVETSPATATTDRLEVLFEQSVDRISIGVQSFFDAEVHAVGRAQKKAEVIAALDRIRAVGFPTLNIDLIYGLPGQTVASWQESLAQALAFQPEELYLYPLYVRPLTGLGKSDREWDDIRLACYRAGREFLLSQGYEQVSMRMFRASHTPVRSAPVYCCQEDGMVGIGSGARSYTRGLHYSREYAVQRRTVLGIIADYMFTSPADFATARYGFRLDQDEQRRRYVIKSILQVEGLNKAAYRMFFHSRPLEDLPELQTLIEQGLAVNEDERIILTNAGLERSDVIAPYLFSAPVRHLMEAYTLR